MVWGVAWFCGNKTGVFVLEKRALMFCLLCCFVFWGVWRVCFLLACLQGFGKSCFKDLAGFDVVFGDVYVCPIFFKSRFCLVCIHSFLLLLL